MEGAMPARKNLKTWLGAYLGDPEVSGPREVEGYQVTLYQTPTEIWFAAQKAPSWRKVRSQWEWGIDAPLVEAALRAKKPVRWAIARSEGVYVHPLDLQTLAFTLDPRKCHRRGQEVMTYFAPLASFELVTNPFENYLGRVEKLEKELEKERKRQFEERNKPKLDVLALFGAKV
jgi:hypothetical protein